MGERQEGKKERRKEEGKKTKKNKKKQKKQKVSPQELGVRLEKVRGTVDLDDGDTISVSLTSPPNYFDYISSLNLVYYIISYHIISFSQSFIAHLPTISKPPTQHSLSAATFDSARPMTYPASNRCIVATLDLQI